MLSPIEVAICRKYRGYIAYIDTRISVSVSHRHFKYRFFQYNDIVSMKCEISVISRHIFIILFNVNSKTDNYTSKTEYLILQYDTSLHLYYSETKVKE